MSVQIVTLDDVSALVPGPAGPGAPPPTLPDMLRPPAGQRLYAIVDAGLFDWVIYEIGDSGRGGACLFDVSRDRAVAEHAPWLVDLGAQPGLARKFMTRGEEPWTTWGRPGILFLHSAENLTDLRAHFRRIVQIPRVDQGGHVFLRFWTQDILHDLCAAVSDDWTGPLRVFGPEGAPLVTACFLPAGDGAALARIKSYLDYGAFTPIQVASAAALNGPQDCVAEIREIYKSRRDVLVDGLAAAGWDIPSPPATMFAWAPIPSGFEALGSLEFSKLLLSEAGVAVSPGIGFGEHGDDFVRLALVENEHRIRQAARNIKRFLSTASQTLDNVIPLSAHR